MRLTSRAIAFFLAFTALAVCVVADGTASTRVTDMPSTLQRFGAGDDYLPDEVVVRFRRSLSNAELQITAVSVEALGWKPLLVRNAFVVELSEDTTVPEAVAELSARSDVEYAEPNYIYKAAAVPNDPELVNLWGLHNTGQAIPGSGAGTPDADIDAIEAWNVTTGSPNVVVAVIDSGVAYGHPDLDGNIWTNPGELAGNGFDDDGNGFIDDVRGWDFVQGDNEPLDFNGHGTHVAGTIGAEGNDGLGVVGVNWDVSIMPIRGLDASGSGTTASLANAVTYACQNGAQITNNSWGGSGASFTIFDAFADCPTVLHVVAAGNSGLDLDGPPASFPCEYDGPDSPFGALSFIVCVASSTNTEGLSSFSNHGTESVHLAAPGSAIRSSIPSFTQVGSTETFDPIIGGWTGSGSPNSWARAGVPSAGDGSAADSPAGNYATAADNAFQRDAAFNFAGLRGCGLDYQLRLATELEDDFFLLEVSTDGGANWTTAGGWSGSTGGGFMDFFDDLSSADGAPTALFRLGLLADGDGAVADGAYVDDLVFRCLNPGSASYDYFNGTSMATPHVTGVAALILARNPTLSAGSVKSILLSGVDTRPAFTTATITGGRLNAATALALTPPPPLPPPTSAATAYISTSRSIAASSAAAAPASCSEAGALLVPEREGQDGAEGQGRVEGEALRGREGQARVQRQSQEGPRDRAEQAAGREPPTQHQGQPDRQQGRQEEVGSAQPAGTLW